MEAVGYPPPDRARPETPGLTIIESVKADRADRRSGVFVPEDPNAANEQATKGQGACECGASHIDGADTWA